MADKVKVTDLANMTLTPYTKDDDPKGFIRRRVSGKTVINGKACQVTGYVTQIKGQ